MPSAVAKAFARFANSAGKRWLGGVFTKSRAVTTAVATAAPRSMASFCARPLSPTSNVTFCRPASLGAVLALRNSAKRYPPSTRPCTVASTSRSDSVVTRISTLSSERAATPAARRIVSASSALPSPTASTLATGNPSTTTRVSCSAEPVAPTAVSAASMDLTAALSSSCASTTLGLLSESLSLGRTPTSSTAAETPRCGMDVARVNEGAVYALIGLQPSEGR
ncbi:Uncharacterised protein [Mycobacteroides abscessus subsp. abscessus]|nr:Uncharacterised protein [Mycobacteroides abscessus subsp. abscessus]